MPDTKSHRLLGCKGCGNAIVEAAFAVAGIPLPEMPEPQPSAPAPRLSAPAPRLSAPVPRLTAAINDPAAANRMINEQTEVALLIAGPALLALLGLAPYALTLLFSSGFEPAAALLRWQVLGDVLRLGAWPLGFALLAAGRGRAFMGAEIAGVGVLVLMTWLLIPAQGNAAPGLALIASYALYLPLVYHLVRRPLGLQWPSVIWWLAGALLTLGIGIMAVAAYSALTGALAGVVAGGAFALYALARLAQKTELDGPLGKAAAMGRRLFTRWGTRHE